MLTSTAPGTVSAESTGGAVIFTVELPKGESI